MFDPGTLIEPNGGADDEPLFEIVSVDTVRIILFVPMEDSAELSVGDKAVLHSVPSATGVRFHGKISRMARAFHEGSRMMRAEIDLENPPDGQGRRQLKPADYGKVDLALHDFPAIPAVPLSAISTSNGKAFLFVVDQDNRCWKQNVEVGIAGAAAVGLAAGVSAGQRVLVENNGNVRDGDQLSGDMIDLVQLKDISGV